MKNNRILVIMILFIAATICVYAIAKNKTTPEKDKPYNPNDVTINSFDLSFLKLETNKENLIYSPLSIKYARHMVDEGANGNTKAIISANTIETTQIRISNLVKEITEKEERCPIFCIKDGIIKRL